MADEWTLLMTGLNHGLVGKKGKEFESHPATYPRVDVVRSFLADKRVYKETLEALYSVNRSLRKELLEVFHGDERSEDFLAGFEHAINFLAEEILSRESKGKFK